MKNLDVLSCTVRQKADVRAFVRQMIDTIHCSQRRGRIDMKQIL